MTEYRKQSALTVAVAVVVVLVMAGASVYLFPSGPGTTTTGVSTNSSITTALGSSTATTSVGLRTTTTSTTGIVGAGWNYFDLSSAVYNSSEVKPHIADVYYYDTVAFAAPNDSNPYVEVYVVGAQVVSGNWTTGYTVTYTGRQVFNVTVHFTRPSTYNVTGTVETNLADQSSQISFNATQRQAIQTALENSTVKADLSGMQYYVYHAFATPNPNGTGTVYVIQIAQVNGYKAVQIEENSTLTEVLNVVTFTESLDLQP